MVIDFHTHIFPDKIAPAAVGKLQQAGQIPAYSDGTGRGLLASMAEAGITHSVLLPVATNPLKLASVNNSAIERLSQPGFISFGAMHRPVDESAIRAAAEQSDASDFISRLPREFDTPLMRMFEQDGIELSGGQWQKLAVARAFYADSEILILDEPTAALDPLAEQEIYNQFDRLRKDKTTIFVSHRLSCATTADMIVVLEDGQVVECGDHEELMALHGRYHRLFTVQADRYERRREDHNLDPHGDRPRGDRPRRRPHDFE